MVFFFGVFFGGRIDGRMEIIARGVVRAYF